MNLQRIKKIRTVLCLDMTPESPGERVLFDALDNLLSALLEDEKTSTAGVLTVDLDGWDRINEVRNYARFHDIAPAEAIERLVNSGLSHENRGWTS